MTGRHARRYTTKKTRLLPLGGAGSLLMGDVRGK